MACQAEQETNVTPVFTISTPLSHKATVSSELLEGTVTFSEKCDTTVDPFVDRCTFIEEKVQPQKIQYCTWFQRLPGEFY